MLQGVQHVVRGQGVPIGEGDALVEHHGQLQIAGPLVAGSQVVHHSAVVVDLPQGLQHGVGQGPGRVGLQVSGGVKCVGVGIRAKDKSLGALRLLADRRTRVGPLIAGGGAAVISAVATGGQAQRHD